MSGRGVPLSRRSLLKAAAAGLILPHLKPLPARGEHDDIRPRDSWGADLPPTGPLDVEADGDVRFLIVHHTATSNRYGTDDVPRLIRSFYNFHTRSKGWPDVAYNFLVDRHGVIWEARAGSIEAPVKGDATGGSQGYAILCSLIGDHSSEPPTEAATGSLVRLLADLCQRYGIDPTPGSEVNFISRGSDKWPAGTEVSARTISGHRDMSFTACPGDVGYRVVTDELPSLVAAAIERQQTPSREEADPPRSRGDASVDDETAADASTRETPGVDEEPSTPPSRSSPSSRPAAHGPDAPPKSAVDEIGSSSPIGRRAQALGAAAVSITAAAAAATYRLRRSGAPSNETDPNDAGSRG